MQRCQWVRMKSRLRFIMGKVMGGFEFEFVMAPAETSRKGMLLTRVVGQSEERREDERDWLNTPSEIVPNGTKPGPSPEKRLCVLVGGRVMH